MAHAEADSRSLSFSAVGSAMFTRRLRTVREPRFSELLTHLREADAAFCNLEAPIYEPAAYPVKQHLYTSYVTSEPWVADELRWAGFNLVSLANNHMSDWSPESVETNLRLLWAAGIACSGAGRSLAEARAPAYLDTPGGRVGLICVDSSYEHGAFIHVQMAGDPHGGVRARPGTNGLRWDTTYELSPADFDDVRRVHRSLGLHRHGIETAHTPPLPSASNFRFRSVDVRRAGETRVRTACRESDLEQILRWIRSTRAQVDRLVVSHHNHAASGADWELPADFARQFAHAAIDAGADAYIGHGYTLKGVELRRGRPIFHDVGDWALQDASARRHPGDVYAHWGLDPLAPPGEFADARERMRTHVRERTEDDELRATVVAYTAAATSSVLVRFAFAADTLTEVTLVPCVLSRGPRHRRDLPLRARGADAERVLERVARASAPYGTRIDVRDCTGHVLLS